MLGRASHKSPILWWKNNIIMHMNEFLCKLSAMKKAEIML
ncbi:hypothetical protein HMPREF0880_01580 [Yokenella regensburgei ATCC 43003]|nr:hypothetical protein HMPREF0880_01580 [Yokenella regensburgei ATCC 43003]